MDPNLINAGKTFEQRVSDMEAQFLRMLLEGIKGGTIKFEDGQKIARFVLSRIDDIKNQSQLVVFLHDLSEKWEIFAQLYKVETVRITEIGTQEKKLDEIKSQLLQFSK